MAIDLDAPLRFFRTDFSCTRAPEWWRCPSPVPPHRGPSGAVRRRGLAGGGEDFTHKRVGDVAPMLAQRFDDRAHRGQEPPVLRDEQHPASRPRGDLDVSRWLAPPRRHTTTSHAGVPPTGSRQLRPG